MRLARTIGAFSVLNGSDNPYPEGLAVLDDFVDELGALGDTNVKQLIQGNFSELIA